MKTKGILPSGVRLTAKRRGRVTEFVYEEDFQSAALVKRTVGMLAGVVQGSGLKVEARGKRQRAYPARSTTRRSRA